MRIRIGTIGVDSGMVYVGDPCYVIDRPLGRKTWEEFLDELWAGGDEDSSFWTVHTTQTEASSRMFPCGVVTKSGQGDGEYPVYAEFAADGCTIARLIVDFE